MAEFGVAYHHPSDTSSIVKNAAEPPHTSPPPPAKDTNEYLCGSSSFVTTYQGANGGRDQDRSRVDECTPGSYSYVSRSTQREAENETGVTEGF